MPNQHENVKRVAVFIRIERAPPKSLWAKVGVTIFAVKILENYLIRMHANIKRKKQTNKQEKNPLCVAYACLSRHV